MILSKFLQSQDPREELIPIAQPFEDTLPSPSSGIFDIPSIGEFSIWASIMSFLGALWSIYAIIAYIVSIILLVLFVYASVRKNFYAGLQTQMLRDAERLYDEQIRGTHKNSRIKDIMIHSDSENPNDWKLAIIESDIILDDILKKKGYPGNSLGERLKNISSKQLNSLQDAWEAHKVRNRIAHDGADFVLTKRVAQETIARYQRVFTEFDVT